MDAEDDQRIDESPSVSEGMETMDKRPSSLPPPRAWEETRNQRRWLPRWASRTPDAESRRNKVGEPQRHNHPHLGSRTLALSIERHVRFLRTPEIYSHR